MYNLWHTSKNQLSYFFVYLIRVMKVVYGKRRQKQLKRKLTEREGKIVIGNNFFRSFSLSLTSLTNSEYEKWWKLWKYNKQNNASEWYEFITKCYCMFTSDWLFSFFFSLSFFIFPHLLLLLLFIKSIKRNNVAYKTFESFFWLYEAFPPSVAQRTSLSRYRLPRFFGVTISFARLQLPRQDLTFHIETIVDDVMQVSSIVRKPKQRVEHAHYVVQQSPICT